MSNYNNRVLLDSGDRRALENVTIVILSRQRQQFLKRAIAYWLGSGAKVLALDDSPTAIEFEPSHSNSDLIYIHSISGIVDRAHLALKHVKTNFVAFQCDDEFLLQSVVADAVDFLSTNSDYAAINGNCFLFSYSPYLGLRLKRVYERARMCASMSDSPIARIKHLLSNYCPISYYAVTRRENWELALKAWTKSDEKIEGLLELKYEMTISFLGKVFIANKLYWLRSAEVGPAISAPPKEVNQHFASFWQQLSNPEKSGFSEKLLQDWKVDKKNHQDIRHIIDGLTNYCAKVDIEKFFRRYQQKNEYWLYREILLPIKRAYTAWSWKPLGKALSDMKRAGQGVEPSDVEGFKAAISEHYKKRL